MVKNFRVVQENAVALSGFPASAEEVDWLAAQGVKAVLSLHPIPEESRERLRERGIEWRPMLIDDFTCDFWDRLPGTLEWVRARSEQDPLTLIHCQGGGGRASTIYAAYLVYTGTPVEDAIALVPGVTRDDQKEFLRGVAARLGPRDA